MLKANRNTTTCLGKTEKNSTITHTESLQGKTGVPKRNMPKGVIKYKIASDFNCAKIIYWQKRNYD